MAIFKQFWRTLLYILLTVFLFTHHFKGSGGGGIPHFDKVVHFGLFAMLVCIALYDTRLKPQWRNRILVVSLIYGVGVEVIQGVFLPYRSASVWDVVADLAGIVAGAIVFRGYKNSRFYKPAA